MIHAAGGHPLAVVRPSTNMGALPMQTLKAPQFLARPGVGLARNIAPAAEYSPDQLAFLKRREQETGKKYVEPYMGGAEPPSSETAYAPGGTRAGAYGGSSSSSSYSSSSSSSGGGTAHQ